MQVPAKLLHCYNYPTCFEKTASEGLDQQINVDIQLAYANKEITLEN